MSRSSHDQAENPKGMKSSFLTGMAFCLGMWALLTGSQALGPESSTSLLEWGHITISVIAFFGFLFLMLKGKKEMKAVPSAGFFALGTFLLAVSACGQHFFGQDAEGIIPLVLAGASGLAPWVFFLAGIDLYQNLKTPEQGNPLLDGAVAAAGMGLPAWHFVVTRVWLTPGEWDFTRAMVALQPIGYTACLFAAVTLIAQLNRRGKVRSGPALVVTGLVLFALGGSLEAYQLALRLNSTPEVSPYLAFDGLVLAAGLGVLALSALAGLWGDSGDWRMVSGDEVLSEPFQLSLARVIVPNVLSLGTFVFTAIHEIQTKGHVSPIIVAVGFVLMGVAMARQAVVLLRGQAMLRDNELLTEKLRQVTGGLEEKIAQRTRQLTALHQLTKAVSNTLDPREVLSMAAVHGRTALRADAVVLWLAEKDRQNGTIMKGALQLGLSNQPELSQQLFSVTPIDQVRSLPLPMEPNSPTGPVATLLMAPMVGQQNLIGMIGVLRYTGGFSKTDWELIEAIGLEAGTALKHAQQYTQARAAADLDPVTGLLNHRAIHQRLDETLETAEADQRSITVMMMDMNNFKMFNDTYGHPAGDEALRRVAKALGETVQSAGTVGRYGGDEFLAVLPGITQEQAGQMAQHLKARLLRSGFVPNPQDGRVIPITLSFGIASFPQDSRSRHELIAMADSNLYAAKRSDEGIRMTSDTQRVNSQLRNENSFAVLDGMVTAVDNKDSYTRRHSEDVAEYSLWIAEELGLSPEALRTIRIGALLHDVGKITVPDEILRKPGRLTPEEFEILKRHPRLGALIVSGVPGMETILDIVQHHHERWDGKGYPDELKGEEIPMLGRLVAVADTFSAMTTDRPYRKGLSWEVALKEIQDSAGTQFDPDMADAFLRAAAKRKGPLKLAS